MDGKERKATYTTLTRALCAVPLSPVYAAGFGNGEQIYAGMPGVGAAPGVNTAGGFSRERSGSMIAR